MFTGIVETTASIVETQVTVCGKRLRLELGTLASECRIGDSISVNGACLTVSAASNAQCDFDVIPETLQRTNLGLKSAGDRVNIERSLRVGDRFDGHFVQGHVDATTRVVEVRRIGGEHVLRLASDPVLRDLLIPKGSVCVDGVSLTIARVTAADFEIALIPTTLERTTLGELIDGDIVNIESDLIARVILQQIRAVSGLGPRSVEFTESRFA